MEAQGIADLLVDGVWYAFAAGSIFGTFIGGPLLISVWDWWQDKREAERFSREYAQGASL